MNSNTILEIEAESYWDNEYGDSNSYTDYDQVTSIETQIKLFEDELTSIEKEIQSRSLENMNQFKINRAIELHFLLKSGRKYLFDCILKIEEKEESLVDEYSSDYRDYPGWQDNFFTRDYDSRN